MADYAHIEDARHEAKVERGLDLMASWLRPDDTNPGQVELTVTNLEVHDA